MERLRRFEVEQELALGVMLGGRNCFLTGAAGAGKTYVLNKFIAEARRRKKKVAVTASTGIAATHVNGNTIHSWSGIGAYDELPGGFFTKMPKSRRDVISKAEILVIDEISMLNSAQFDMVEEVCRKVRGGEEAFGGLQVIVSGDFFQLPPVVKRSPLEGIAERAYLNGKGRVGGLAGQDLPDRQYWPKGHYADSLSGKSCPANPTSAFAVRSRAWGEADFAVLYLEGNFRQEDGEYLDILNSLRSGGYRRGQIEKLMERVGAEISDEVTELYTHNRDVDRENERRLRMVEGEEWTYEYAHTGSAKYYEKLAKNILAPEVLKLKKGALVMTVKNAPDKGYYNGSTGVVVGFEAGWPEVEFRNGRRVVVEPATWELMDGETRRASVTQVPLRLAWAITVHKSQGMTLDAAKVDLSRAFEKGMGYVALSRVKSLEALSLRGINRMAIAVSEEAREMDVGFREACGKLVGECGDELAQVGREVFERKVGVVEKRERKGKELTPEEEARKVKWAERVEREREKWPNARKAWSIEDSDWLIDGFLDGKSVEEMSEKLGRKPRSIMMRVNDSFSEEIFTDDEWKM